VAEVASIGGWVRQYQIDVNPLKLRAYTRRAPLRSARWALL
jgi:Cu/Ag efflux pump CusA